MGGSHEVTIRFALPSAALSPFVTTYYWTGLEADPDQWVEDYLHPEWANIRFLDQGSSQSAVGGGALKPSPSFAVTGPTSLATRFLMRAGRSWGIGLLPLGWANFVDAPASDFADRGVDGFDYPAFDAFAPLARQLASSSGNFEEELAIIESHMAGLLDRKVDGAGSIIAINSALVDETIVTVGQLAERVDTNVRTLERHCRKAFGFAPKLLIRRQRFLRSLSQFMLDPSLKWLNAMDYQYHDQAHFHRDFRRFMGMSPSDYARRDHPFLMAAARARAAIAGQAVQGLHPPGRGEPVL